MSSSDGWMDGVIDGVKDEYSYGSRNSIHAGSGVKFQT